MPVTAEDHFGPVDPKDWVAVQTATHRRLEDTVHDDIAAVHAFDVDEDAPLAWFENDGRLLVMCDQCRSAQIVFTSHPYFFCVECGNAAHDRKWRPIVEPDPEPETEEG